MRTSKNGWVVEFAGGDFRPRIGEVITISDGDSKVTVVACPDHTDTCDACCVKDVFGLVTCEDVPVYCWNLCFKLAEDML